jgi:hypothetical protein
MAIQISGTTVIDNSRNINAGIGTFTNLNVTPQPLLFSPSDGSIDNNLGTNISITFSQLLQKGTGNITLRSGSASGTILETISVTSDSVTISGATVTINPVNDLPTGTNVFVVIPAGAFTSINFTSPTALIDTYNFLTVNFALLSINPGNSATNVSISSNITLSFTAPPTRGTGTITLRRDSNSGTILESFDAASSNRISVSGSNWILDPSSNLPHLKSIHLVIPSTGILNYNGLNVAGANTHSFTTADLLLGESYEGGFAICKSSPTRWVVAPSSSEVNRSWYYRTDANTRAQQVSGCTGWFVPSIGQLQNPGYNCRAFWDSYVCATYWSDTSANPRDGWDLDMSNGVARSNSSFPCHNNPKSTPKNVRAFRCVTY